MKFDFKVLGISSGLGVSLFPFKKWLIANIEARSVFHTPKNENWKINFPGIPLFKTFDSFDGLIPNIIISSPDCGSGSIFRFSRAKALGDHTKNDSLLLFFKAVTILKPKLFLFENLDGLFKSFNKKTFKNILHNYYLVEHNASVAHWGNSQKTRKRLVIVGIRRDLPYKKIRKYFKLPEIPELKKCVDLYGNLDKDANGNVREYLADIISIHGGRRMQIYEILIEWNNRLKGKKRWYVEGNSKYKTAPGVYRNLANDYPATARRANRQFDHRGLMLTPRQLARIQGVPDNFKIHIKIDKLNYWINKGRTVVTKTPPYEISVWFLKQLKKSYKLWNSNFSTTF